ncbi:uncharacterized protein LOC133034425 [Cannabis sativa]|uniref:uncharacterized protein LOC133034425 n=1 Tax=Cannabis sativa TaxID=3483 RepID=UPI0029CAA83C|nr:uncharacterized protein LOC133034425 [Cannabis sativa]
MGNEFRIEGGDTLGNYGVKSTSEAAGNSKQGVKPTGLIATTRADDLVRNWETPKRAHLLKCKWTIGVGALVETKLKGKKVKDLMSKNFIGWDSYTSPNIEGRLLLIWKQTFSRVIVIEENIQYVHCYVKLASHIEAFCVTFVYGMNGIEDRKMLWKGLANLRFPVKPWILLGDFNSLINYGDRGGGTPVSRAEVEDFNNWLSLGLVDSLKRQGSYFTWSNNQGSQDRIYSKIDHAFKNEDWLDLFPNSTASFSWEEVSKHCAIVISSAVMVAIGVKSFKFFNYWSEHRDFKNLVLESWHKPVCSTGLLGIWFKLSWLKHVLKAFNHTRMGNVEMGYQRAKERFLEARLQAQNNPRVEMFLLEEKTAAESYLHHERMLKSFLVQRSKQLRLIHPFTNKEINEALFSIPRSKSPGPDGYNSEFFKVMWTDIGAEVCCAIKEFFSMGKILAQFNETVISLIPKVENPMRAIDYRPIASCSTLYKCITKLMSKRLSEVLLWLVHQNQGAFIKKRSIAHNILIFQDLIKNYGRKIVSPRCTIKIDLSKACDTVDWGFVEDLLVSLNFPSKFVNWIMMCLRGTSYTIMLNGRFHGNFQGKKGLWQGDPMSPLLFVLIMEYLSRSLMKETTKHSFRFHPMCKSFQLVSLCFTDDLILFSKGSPMAVHHLKIALESFSEVTCLFSNKDKSLVYFGGVYTFDKEVILEDLQFGEGFFPLRYLGVPLRPTKWRREDCDAIIKKIKMRLMNIFILPQSFIKEIERLCRDF